MLVIHQLSRIAQSSRAHRAESMSVIGYELTVENVQTNELSSSQHHGSDP